jgi:uncharacterized protein DUF4390
MKWLALVLVLASSVAYADDEDDNKPEDQRMRFVERGEVLTVNANIAKLFDSTAYNALSSGFVTTVELRMFVNARDVKETVAETTIKRSVVYDMWDETYAIKLCDDCKPLKVKSPAEALKLITTLDDVPIAATSDIPYGSPDDNVYYLAIRADLNPVDAKTMTEVRRWLSKGQGGGLDRGSTLFGSFVSVFVNTKIADADRKLFVRSQPFYRPHP